MSVCWLQMSSYFCQTKSKNWSKRGCFWMLQCSCSRDSSWLHVLLHFYFWDVLTPKTLRWSDAGLMPYHWQYCWDTERLMLWLTISQFVKWQHTSNLIAAEIKWLKAYKALQIIHRWQTTAHNTLMQHQPQWHFWGYKMYKNVHSHILRKTAWSIISVAQYDHKLSTINQLCN